METAIEITDAVETPKRKPGRPRKPSAIPAPTFSAEQFEQLIGVLASTRQSGAGITSDDLKDILTGATQVTAAAMQKAMKPENQDHPGISCFSYPEGDQKHPKPTLPYELFWNGYPVHMFPETQTWREMELLCALEPGEYTVLMKDGSKMSISAKAETDADGKVTKLVVSFPVSREDKWRVPSMQVALYQMVHRDRPLRQAFMEAMIDYMQVTLVAGES